MPEVEPSAEPDDRERVEAAQRRLCACEDAAEAFEFLTASDGDPIGLFTLGAMRARSRALLVDAERLFDQALGRVALAAASFRGESPFDPWLLTCIDRAIEDVLRQDAEEERHGVPLIDEWDPRYEFLVYMMGIPPEDTRRALVSFNGLRDDTRSIFFAMCIEELSVEECLERFGEADYVRNAVVTGFKALFGELSAEELAEASQSREATK